MIDLYAAGTSNGMRARIALEECGLAYTFHPINLAKDEQKTPEFLKLNPFAQIPVLVDSDGPGGKPVTLHQSSAILLYAAEKSGRHLPKDPAARPAFLEALMSASTDITPQFGAVNAAMRAKEVHAPTVEALTIADLSLYAGYWRTRGAMADVVAGLSNLERWGAEMAARPAIQRALKI